MKERITDENIRTKYDRTIDFIRNNERKLVSENNL